MSSPTPRSMTGTVDNRIIAMMRLVLAASALAITYIDPSQPDRFVVGTYSALSLYTLYSIALYVVNLRNSSLAPRIQQWAHWLDVAWYVLLISLSNGTSSIYFFGFFFAILVASFRWGFAAGFRVTIASVVLFSTIGVLTAPGGEAFELNRSLVRPVYLLALGYMMAYWGGYEIRLKRRLELLKEVGALSNPRFGADRMIGLLLERLRAFYNADACLVISSDPAGEEYQLRRASREDGESAMRPTPMPAELAQQLLALPNDIALVYSAKPRNPGRRRGAQHAVDIRTRERWDADPAVVAPISAMLEADAFITVPIRYRGEPPARLYLTASRDVFDEHDIDLVLQVFEHVTPVIDNIRLVDRLASDAAEQERQRIARDLHDSVIQPYIGLQMGLASVRGKYERGASDIAADLDRLSALTNDGIAELRGYVRGLKSGGEREGTLHESIKRFASKFGTATGIAVDVEAKGDVRCNDRLGAEVFQMVAEALSNIRRHTQAAHATVELSRANGHLVLRVENEGSPGTPHKPFTPRSITERATALGGRAVVEPRPDSGTAIVVEIPL